MLYLPLLLFFSSLAWACELWDARLVRGGAAGLHLLFGLLLLLAAGSLRRGDPARWPRAARAAWHVFWLAALLFCNLAAAGNWLSRSHWGDPLSLEAMVALLRQDSVIGTARDLVAWSSLLYLIAGLGLLAGGFAAYLALAATPAGLRGGRAFRRASPWLLAAAVALAAFELSRHPALAREEPLYAFVAGSSNFSDLPGLDERRAAVRKRDREALLSYDPGKSRPRKNVVLILADSLRADHLPAYGYGRPLTPFLDRLWADPRTQKAEWAFSSCSESFCGITSALTGHPYQDVSHGSVKVYDYLARAGYQAELVLSGDHRHLMNLGQFYGDARLPQSPEFAALAGASDDRAVLGWLDGLEPFDGRPRFIFIFLMSSHVGGRRLPEFRRYLPDNSNLARARWNNDDALGMLRSIHRPASYLERVVDNYDNGLLQTDYFLGKIFDGLEERGYLDDALLLISSDHADSMGEHNHVGHTYRLYNVDMRIPLFLWDSDPATRPKELPIAAQPSFAPTILHRLGLPIPPTLEAPPLDLAPPLFRSEHLTRRPQEPCAAAIEGTPQELYKLIACARAGELREELYELIGDPGERRDLLADPAAAAGEAGRAAALRGRLDFFYRELLGRR